MPTAEAAFSIGTAKPMPMKVRASVGLRMAVTMPTTCPSIVTSGPPELPGLAAASNWIRLVSIFLPSGSRNSRFSPETTPPLTLGPMPKGWPTATTWSPGRRSEVERIVAASRSSGSELALSTARSFSGCMLITTASDSWPLWKRTLMRLAPQTTCRLVRIVPLSRMTTPVPRLRFRARFSASSVPSSFSSIRPTTRTTEGAMASAAFA
jgi:hypothetical protein